MKYLATLLVALVLIPSTTFAYQTQRGDTPLKVFGTNWAEAMRHYFGHSDSRRLPVNAIVDPNGWKPLGARTYVLPDSITGDTITATTGTITNIVNPSIKEDDTTVVTPTSTLLTNGSFESTPFDTGWTTVVNPISATTSVTTTAYEGTQAFSFDLIADDVNAGAFYQSVVGNAGKDLQVSFAHRGNTTASTSAGFKMVLTNSTSTTIGSPTEGFTECFDMSTSTGTWISATSSVSANYSKCEVKSTDMGFSTSTYSNSVLSDYYVNMEIPSSSAAMIIVFPGGATGDSVLFDSFVFSEKSYSTVVPATPITPNLFTNTSDYSLIDVDDKFCLFRVNGGTTSTCMLGFDGLSDLYINKSQVCTKLNIYSMTTSTATCF